MEREIGDIFEYFGTTLEVVKSNECDNCYFNHNGCSERFTAITGFVLIGRDLMKPVFRLKKFKKNNYR